MWMPSIRGGSIASAGWGIMNSNHQVEAERWRRRQRSLPCRVGVDCRHARWSVLDIVIDHCWAFCVKTNAFARNPRGLQANYIVKASKTSFIEWQINSTPKTYCAPHCAMSKERKAIDKNCIVYRMNTWRSLLDVCWKKFILMFKCLLYDFYRHKIPFETPHTCEGI